MKNRGAGIITRVLVLYMMFVCSGAAEDLKAYFEKQKAEFIPTFVAPQLGSEVNIKLAAGQPRSGILMKQNTESISLMTDTGMVTYKRKMMHETSRAVFFAEDYAAAKALEKTREYKQQLHLENVAENEAGMHEGRISVSAKLDKKSDKDVEEEDRENKKSGNTTTITTTTRTYTEIQNLQITVANNTSHPDAYTLEWFFFGKSPVTGAVTVHDEGTRRVSVDGRKRKQEKVKSEPFIKERVERNTMNSNSNYSRDAQITESGKESHGWLVILKFGNEVMDMKASAKTFMSEEWMSKVQ